MDSEFERLKAKVHAADDADEKFYFVSRAAGSNLAQAPALITQLQAAGALEAHEAAELFGRLLSAAAPSLASDADALSLPPPPPLPPPPHQQPSSHTHASEPAEPVLRAVRSGSAPSLPPSADSIGGDGGHEEPTWLAEAQRAVSLDLGSGAPSAPPHPSASATSATSSSTGAVPAAHAAASASASEPAPSVRHEVLARAVELGMDVTHDRKFLWIAAEALDAPMPDGWEARYDALGLPYYVEVASMQSSREHPSNGAYRKRFFALKLEEVGYRRLMLSRVTSTHLFDAIAPLSEAECSRLEVLFEQHDRDKDGVVSFHEFALLAEEAAARQGVQPFPTPKLRAIFVAADLNHDGAVDFNEFCRAQMRKGRARTAASRSRRSSPASSVAGSQAGDSPRTWPTPPITPRDPLDSPSTLSVASTHIDMSTPQP